MQHTKAKSTLLIYANYRQICVNHQHSNHERNYFKNGVTQMAIRHDTRWIGTRSGFLHGRSAFGNNTLIARLDSNVSE